ncbi:MAG: hypothetical protein AAF197_07120 [Pseudomonadota bacterium]
MRHLTIVVVLLLSSLPALHAGHDYEHATDDHAEICQVCAWLSSDDVFVGAPKIGLLGSPEHFVVVGVFFSFIAPHYDLPSARAPPIFPA